MQKTIRPAFLIVFIFVNKPLAHAENLRDVDKWGPHIDLEGKAGTDRNLGETDLFIPLWQDDDTLTFGSIRARMDDNNSHEGNFGVGIRQMLDNNWNIGGYGYFDRRHSPHGNKFNQLTFGAEALSMDWDFRANAYFPIGTTSYFEDSLNVVDFSGTSILFKQGEERAIGGFDGEIGWRVPLFEADAGQQLRAYAGGYRFAETNVKTVQGPRGRLDLTFDEIPFLWEGSRFSLGAEIQHDSPRGTQGFANFRLRIPLQGFGDVPKPKLTAMERRMADPIIRDIDIVSQAGQFTEFQEITATADGKEITLVKSDTTPGTGIKAAIENAGANSTVVLNGNYTGVDNTLIAVQDGQSIIGGGALDIKTPDGRTVAIPIPSASISGTGSNGGSGSYRLFDMSDNSSLIGITATITRAESTTIARIDGKQNVTIRGNTIKITSDNTASGIQFDDASNVTMENNKITVVSTAGDSQFATFQGINSNIAISNNTTSLTAAGDNYYLFFAGGAQASNLSGTGNTSNDTTCHDGGAGPITGSVTVNGITCP